MSIPGLSDGSDPSGTQFQTTFQREAPQIEARKLQLMDTAAGFARDPVDIPVQEVVDFTDLQTEAFNRTAGGLGSFEPFINAATQNLLGSTAAYDPMSYQAFMNPFQNEVISGIEDQFAKLQNQTNLQAAKAGAFGGARQGVQSAELGRQQAQAVGQAQAQNFAQAQQMATGRFDERMNRLQNVAGGYGQQAAQRQQLGQGDLASLFAAGSQKQQRAQQVSDAQYRQQIQQMYEPYQRIGFVSDIYQGMPSSSSALTMGSSPMTNPVAQAVGAGITGLSAYQGYQNAFGQA